MTTLATPDVGDSRRPTPAWIRMTWVTWRQHRSTLIAALVLLGGLTAVLALLGSTVRGQWTTLGLDRCLPRTSTGGSCAENLADVANRPPISLMTYVTDGLHLVPVLLGVFVGAPLFAREFESGTFLFTWTQGIGRRRWAGAKLVLLTIPLAVGGAVVGSAFAWWYAPFEGFVNGSRWDGNAFDLSGITLAAWSLFAVLAGAFAGMAIRRTVPAMAVTLGGVGGLALLVPWLVRPRLLHLWPVTGRQSVLLEPGANREAVHQASRFILSTWITGPDGHRITDAERVQLFERLQTAPPGGWDAWLAEHHYASWATYQPASHLWILQAMEATTLVALAALLAIAAVRWSWRHAP